MPVIDPLRRPAAPSDSAPGPVFALLLSLALPGIAFLVAIATLPRTLALPVLCVAALGAAGILAAAAWKTRAQNQPHPNYWDVAGALAFVGFAAAILSKPESVLTAFAGVAAG
jgi:hypothetical protein